jgi:predicted O-methyltransferase YrrM
MVMLLPLRPGMNFFNYAQVKTCVINKIVISNIIYFSVSREQKKVVSDDIYGIMMQKEIINRFMKFKSYTLGNICSINDRFLSIFCPKLRRSFSISSHLTRQERYILYKLSKKMSIIAEIGSYVGASACCFGASAIKNVNAQIICIDTWNNHAMSEGFRDTWAEFLHNTAPYSDAITPIRGFSTQVLEKVLAITPVIDLLFIDGDHSYKGVKADWEIYKYLLKSGSIVIFHDYGWAEGVKRVVHEDVIPYAGSYNSLPNMWWGTLSRQP